MHYELLIPTEDDDHPEVLMTVEASDWMSALRAGLLQLGHDVHPGLLCDIQSDESVHVTDPISRRVFRVRPLSRQELDASLGDTFELDDSERRALLEDPPPPVTEGTRVLSEKRFRSGTFGAIRPSSGVHGLDATTQHLVDDVLQEFQSFYASERALREVSERVLDLAMRLIPSESSAVLFPGLRGIDLYFAAARGPKAEQVKAFRIPIDAGIVGFCIREGVSLAITDAKRDPRFFHLIARKLRYPTRSILCAPLQFDGRVYGAIELINRLDAQPFSPSQTAMLSHIGRQLAQYISLQM